MMALVLTLNDVLLPHPRLCPMRLISKLEISGIYLGLLSVSTVRIAFPMMPFIVAFPSDDEDMKPSFEPFSE